VRKGRPRALYVQEYSFASRREVQGYGVNRNAEAGMQWAEKNRTIYATYESLRE